MFPPETATVPRSSLIDRLDLASVADSETPPVKSFEHPGRQEKASERRQHATKERDRYMKSLKRDLEWLFNTRRTFDGRMERYPQLSTSVYAYGLPDITSADITSVRDQKKLVAIMHRSLEVFDRRLKDIEIDLEPLRAGSRGLRFKINCILLMDPAPEEILIDTVLDAGNSKYEVK